MNTYFKTTLILLLTCTLFSGCTSKKNKEEQQIKADIVNIIFDTDMGNDIDDALALDMLYKYQDENRANLLAIMINKDYYHAPEYIDIMNTWYGYPNIPIGIHKKGEKLSREDTNYTTHVCLMEEEGKTKYKRSLTDYDSLPLATKLYRKTLSEQPDNSVIIISVGFSTNLAALLNTAGDQYSPLNGKELVAKKVKYMSVMAGCFNREDDYSEYNVWMDISSAQKTFAEWPGKIVFSPYELGERVLYPATSIENDFNWTEKHPMTDAYRFYSQMPYDRPTWDLTSVLYVMEPNGNYFSETNPGTVHINEIGVSRFIESEQGKHSYLRIDDDQQNRMLNYFTNIITRPPAKYRQIQE